MKLRSLKTLIGMLFYLLQCLCANGQIITTVAGGVIGHGGYWGDGGPATAAQISLFGSLAVDANGNIYIADGGNQRIRKVDAITGIITTVAGTGVAGYSGDGLLATNAKLNAPNEVSVDGNGNIYISDVNNYRIRKVDMASGIITTFAGNGTNGYSGDGFPATAAEINGGFTAWDAFGNMYLDDGANYRIRKIDPIGNISTIAGIGTGGCTSDGAPATSAIISGGSIGTDGLGNVYYTTWDSCTSVHKINISTGITTRVAGKSDHIGSPYSGDGILATSCHIYPFGTVVNGIGEIYIADYINQRIEKVDTFGIIHTIAGTGVSGFSGDGGLATSAKISYPENVAVDICGNVYIADFNNARVRKVTQPPILIIPTIVLAGVITASAGTSVTVTATVTKTGSSYLIHWMNHGIEFTTTTVPSVTYTKGAGTDTITARVVSTATYGCYDSKTSAGHVVTVEPLGVTPLTPKGELSIYPNPAADVLYIDVSFAAHYRLTDVVGSVVGEGKLYSGANSLPMKRLVRGVYILVVADPSTSFRMTSKIVKQ